jgi:hypothetical protein
MAVFTAKLMNLKEREIGRLIHEVPFFSRRVYIE